MFGLELYKPKEPSDCWMHGNTGIESPNRQSRHPEGLGWLVMKVPQTTCGGWMLSFVEHLPCVGVFTGFASRNSDKLRGKITEISFYG
jgi:hypothetical protein